MRAVAALFLVLLAAHGAARAEPPASIDPSTRSGGAEESFRAFARGWVARAKARGERERANPRLTPGARGVVAIYRQVGAEFETELQATGRPGSPYVGVLRYTENVFNCSDLRRIDCHAVSAVPVTEVFRFRDGRWVY